MLAPRELNENRRATAARESNQLQAGNCWAQTQSWSMKILFALPDLAVPARTGPQKQSLMLVRYMAEQGHECALLAFHRAGPPIDSQRLSEVLPGVEVLGLFQWKHNYAIETLTGLLSVSGVADRLLGGLDHKRPFARALQRALIGRPFDLVHIEGIALAPYLPLAGSAPCIFSIIDSISLRQQRLAEETPQGAARLYRRCAAGLGRALERYALVRATKVHVVSEAELGYLRSIAPRADLETIPLAVADSELAHGPAACGERPPRRLFVSSRLDVNYLSRGILWFLREVFQELRARFSDLTLTVLGEGEPRAPLARELQETPSVRLLRWVDDYNAEVARADIVVVPDPCGTGMKTRVLVAMALGRPVVGTATAFEGLAIENGAVGFCCRSADEFRDSIGRLLIDRELGARMGEAARGFVRERHAMSVIGKQWLALYQRARAKFAAHVGRPEAVATVDLRGSHAHPAGQ